MEPQSPPRVIEAERLHDGVAVTFDDGTAALYPASLLRAVLDQAQVLSKEPED
jgi:hypothetical protein